MIIVFFFFREMKDKHQANLINEKAVVAFKECHSGLESTPVLNAAEKY